MLMSLKMHGFGLSKEEKATSIATLHTHMVETLGISQPLDIMR
jgi:hypothetical protein